MCRAVRVAVPALAAAAGAAVAGVLVAALAGATLACGPGGPGGRTPAPGGAGAGTAAAGPAALGPAAPAPLTDPGMRLPRDLVIAGYDLALTLDPAQPTLTGTVRISGAVARATAVVWLHGEQLTIRRAVATVGGREVALAVDDTIARGKLALVAPAALPVGPATITLDYEARLAETETAGTFRQQAGGDWYAFTQHEPLAARRSFPCLDEPDVKVPWRVEITAPAGARAFANAPAVSDELDGAVRRVRFAPTEPIPSYLVTYAVGPFEVVDAGTSAGGTPHRIITLRGRAADAAYAASIMPRVTTELERWFDMPHPFAKLDSITIPTTTGFSAMEHPGLVTYRESALLVPADASPLRRSRLIGLAAHEIAHQWFGNLVTPVWWDDLWLNESFASWLPEKVAVALEPTWRRPEDAVDARESALGADALSTARRVRQPITSEGDIVTAFDSITYAKGASLLRLFEQRVGAERFRAGVRAYLRAHARGNATAADFLAAIDRVAPDAGAGAMMATFIDQAGAPRLTASVACPADGPPGVALRQERFVPPGAGTVGPARWRLPVCVRAGDGRAQEEACTTLTEPEGFLALGRCPTWVWPNAGGLGYWRSHLDRGGWDALRRHGWKQMTGPERMAAGHDLFAAVASGELDVAVALDLVPVLLAEDHRAAIGAAAGLVAGLEPWVAPAQRRAFATWVRRHFGRRATALGWLPRPSDDLQRAAIRDRVVPLVAEAGADPALAATAARLARRWRALPEATRRDVLVAAVRGAPATAEPLLADFRAETSRPHRADLAAALAAVRDPARLTAALELTLDAGLDIRDTLPILTGAAGRGDTRAVVDGFVIAHLDTLIARLPGDTAGALIGVLVGGCEPLSQVRRDLVEAKLGHVRGARRRIDQAVERVEQCVARRTVITPGLATWLRRP